MPRSISSIVFCIVCASSSSLVCADDVVLEIGGRGYTASDIRDVMNENSFALPDQAVEELQKEAALESMGESEGELYEQTFGIPLWKDNARVKARDLRRTFRNASSRQMVFNNWVAKHAARVPVRYLNIGKYWAIVEETESYKVRAEAGQTLTPENMSYTSAELALPYEAVLASRRGEPYVTSHGFNEYVTHNYEAIYHFVKRRKTLKEARNILIRRLTREKTASENIELRDRSVNDVNREVATFVRNHALDEPLSLQARNEASSSVLMEQVYEEYLKKEEAAGTINRLKDALESERALQNEGAAIRLHVWKSRISALKTDISTQIDEAEVYDWMKEKRYPGIASDARRILTAQRYEEYLDRMLQENEIVVHLLK